MVTQGSWAMKARRWDKCHSSGPVGQSYVFDIPLAIGSFTERPCPSSPTDNPDSQNPCPQPRHNHKRLSHDEESVRSLLFWVNFKCSGTPTRRCRRSETLVPGCPDKAQIANRSGPRNNTSAERQSHAPNYIVLPMRQLATTFSRPRIQPTWLN